MGTLALLAHNRAPVVTHICGQLQEVIWQTASAAQSRRINKLMLQTIIYRLRHHHTRAITQHIRHITPSPIPTQSTHRGTHTVHTASLTPHTRPHTINHPLTPTPPTGSTSSTGGALAPTGQALEITQVPPLGTGATLGSGSALPAVGVAGQAVGAVVVQPVRGQAGF